VTSLESRLNNFIDDVSKAIGSEKVSTDRPTRMCYTLTHGPECLLHENYIEEFLPAVVLRPMSTEDVQEIVKFANKYLVPLVPSGGRTGSYGAEGMRDCAIVDLRSMNRILEFDEKNYRITAEAGLLMADYVKFLRERGYMPLDWPASERSATLGSRVAVNGYNWWENGWGPAEFHVRAIKVVLPNGDAVKLARGSSRPSKCGISYNLMSLFFGSKGTLGIITEVTESFIEIPPMKVYGSMVFADIKDAFEAYLDIKRPRYSRLVWRTTVSTERYLKLIAPYIIKKEWPEECKAVVDYHIFGEPQAVKEMEEKVVNILKNHNGFERPELSDVRAYWDVHNLLEDYMGLASLTKRIKNQGATMRMIFLDPNIPDSNLIAFYMDLQRLFSKMEDENHYPALSQVMTVLESGTPIPGMEGYNKFWVVLLADWEKWDNECRKEFKKWFREYAELVWSHNGSLSTTHGFIPRELEVEFLKRELGEKEYELMKLIKRTLDPNNIMNPKIFF